MTYKKSENNVCEIFRIVYKSGLLSSTFIAMIIFLTGIVPIIQVVVYAKFLDDAILLISSDLNITFMYNSFMLIIILISYQWISNELNKLFCVKLEIKIRENYRIKIVNKISRLEYKYIENKETCELISRIMQNPESVIKNAYLNILNIISLFIRILGVLAILLAQVWWAAVLIVMISIPLFILANKSGKSNYEANREATKFRRKHEYLSEILSNRDSINERELFGFSKYINQEWYNNYEKAREVELKTQIKWFIKLKSGSIITTVLSIIIIFILLKPVIEGTISIGMYISLVSAVFGMIQIMSWKLTWYFDLLAKNNEYINDTRSLFRLASIDDTNDERDIKEFKFSSIEFKNVSFRYPNSNFYVLKDLSFKIEEGKHY
jgi:ABC-type multidrug transport system fused ATPase/permease subunit